VGSLLHPTLRWARTTRIVCGGVVMASVFAMVPPSMAFVLAHSGAVPRPRGHSAGIRIWRPYLGNVSGVILFAAGGRAFGARRAILSLDGRQVKIIHHLRRRVHFQSWINTKNLRNGHHVLSLKIFYRRHIRVLRKTVLVQNPDRGASVARSGTPPTGPASGSSGPPSSSPGAGPGVQSGTPVANFNRETYSFSTNLPLDTEATRYQVLVLQGDQYGVIAQLKAFNPNLKVLLYQNILYTNQGDPASMPTDTGCTPYPDDLTSHPDWFLHDQTGNAIPWPGMPEHYLMDPGNPAYEQTCAANAAGLAKQLGFDGVFLDDVTGGLSWILKSGTTVPEYATPSSWTNAIGDSVAKIGPLIHSDGLLVFGNVAGAPNVATWKQWVSSLDGVETESWTDGGLGLSQQVPYWAQSFQELAWSQLNGKYALLHSFNSTEKGNTFGLAAMLLAASGRASYSTSNTDYGADENWFPEYATAQGLGSPTGTYAILPNGVYERSFANGLVVVNPTEASIASFSLGGGSYSGSGLTAVQSVSMAPTSALILLKDT
jgi:hypothetical protein